ncbi:MAG: hypothetical protein ACRD0Z_08650 [Acidimicrobiales bacterium]
MLRARFTRADRWAAGILVVLPVVLNVTWAIVGHPVLDGDNLTQNYPLRVLAGQLLAHGKLPLWDPGIWSGVELLGGWNAGAMFPGTWLFALLPPIAAYEVNIAATGIVCGLGLYLFARRQGCSALAALLAALSFSEMGFVSGQQCHLGLIEGTAMAPYMLLAVDGIWRHASAARPDPAGQADPASPARFVAGSGTWIALFGLAAGLSILAGDPRAVSSDAITTGIFVLACCWRSRRAARPVVHLLVGSVAGALLGAAVGAAQWLPGLSYLSGSQRAAGGLGLFGFGSLGWGSLPLLVAPYLAGGNGNLGMPDYVGPLNTPEVTFAVGILPVIALFALAPRLFRRGSKLGVWYVMVIVSALLAAGTKTPLGHLLVHVPLYGGQRLQNRNTAIADLALCLILAVFVDQVRAAPLKRRLIEQLAGSVPILAVLGLIGAMFAFPRTMQRWLGASGYHPGLASGMAPYYVVAAAICLAGAVVLWRRHWAAAAWRFAASAVVVADLAVFIAMASYQPIPAATLTSTTPSLAALVRQLPAGARYAIDDPQQLALDYPQFLTDDLGVNDLNLLHGLSSVQGYGSAVPAAYEAATGTHDVENLLPASFLGQIYDDLDLALVVMVPDQFGHILAAGAPPPIPPGRPVPLGSSAADRQPGDVARAAYPWAGPWYLTGAGGGATSWQLPAPTEISNVSVTFEKRYGPVPDVLAVVATLADGSKLHTRATVAGDTATAVLPGGSVRVGGGVLSLSLDDAGPPGAGALGDRLGPRPVVGAVTVTAAEQSAPLMLHQPAQGQVRYVLDGVMQGLLAAPRWQYGSTIGPLVVYRNTMARGTAWLEASSARSPSAPVVPGEVSARQAQAWEDPVEDVTARRPVLLVRSEQYAPGWHVSVRRLGSSRTVTEPVTRIGLLQGVHLGAGRYVVTWYYSSAKADIGLAASATGTACCAGLGWLGLRARRRRRRLAAAAQPA